MNLGIAAYSSTYNQAYPAQSPPSGTTAIEKSLKEIAEQVRRQTELEERQEERTKKVLEEQRRILKEQAKETKKRETKVLLINLLTSIVTIAGGIAAAMFLGRSAIKEVMERQTKPEENTIDFRKINKDNVGELPLLKEIADCEEAKEELELVISEKTRYRKQLKEAGLTQTSVGRTLFGPPGTGKSTLVGALTRRIWEEANKKANEEKNNSEGKPVDVHYMKVSPNLILSKFVGDGPRKVHMIFKKAREIAAKGGIAIIFFDEIDTLAAKDSQSEESGILNQLLLEISDQENNNGVDGGVVVMAATNRLEELEPSFYREGRLPPTEVSFLSKEGIEKLVKNKLSNKNAFQENINIQEVTDYIYENIPNPTGAKVTAILEKAARKSIMNENSSPASYENIVAVVDQMNREKS